MTSLVVPCAASSLLAAVLDSSRSRPAPLVEAARTRLSVHFETARDDVPVLCVCLPSAVRLPGSMVTCVLPSGRVELSGGRLYDATTTWRVTRWWQPPRPTGLAAPSTVPTLAGVPVLGRLRPHDLVGFGPGLTPSGDDILAGALVAAYATADPRLARWRAAVRAALATRSTTAVSRGLLHHALDGWATPELAAFVSAVCAGDAVSATGALLAVGHSSGSALAAGALHALSTRPGALEGAA